MRTWRWPARSSTRYPRQRSALVPLLHLAQEQDGYSPTTRWSTSPSCSASRPPRCSAPRASTRCSSSRRSAGTSSTSAPTSRASSSAPRSCSHHAEDTLGVKAGGTTDDGMFTLEDVRVHRRLHRGALPAGELPLPLQGDDRDARSADRRPARRAGSRARCPRTARWRSSVSRSPPTGGPAPATAAQAEVDERFP